LEELVRAEAQDRARRSLERRLSRARLGAFKPLADFEWDWPRAIDRAAVERVCDLGFLASGSNVILVAAQGLGKTMLAKNVAHQAVLRGAHVLYVTAADLLLDLGARRPAARSNGGSGITWSRGCSALTNVEWSVMWSLLRNRL
jgi:DNA replication protein DnaC